MTACGGRPVAAPGPWTRAGPRVAGPGPSSRSPGQPRARVAAAKAATPSPRPTKPIPSPVVAVEKSTDEESTVPLFRDYSGFSTVDDIDTPSGRLALALLLGGAEQGNYGMKPNVDAPLPKIEQPTGA